MTRTLQTKGRPVFPRGSGEVLPPLSLAAGSPARARACHTHYHQKRAVCTRNKLAPNTTPHLQKMRTQTHTNALRQHLFSAQALLFLTRNLFFVLLHRTQLLHVPLPVFEMHRLPLTRVNFVFDARSPFFLALACLPCLLGEELALLSTLLHVVALLRCDAFYCAARRSLPLRRHERPLLPLTVQQALSKLPVMLSGPGLQLVLCLQTNNLLSTRARFLHVLARTLRLVSSRSRLTRFSMRL